ncbi:biotin holocarboxylase synthetase, partial [Perkinsus olseni]
RLLINDRDGDVGSTELQELVDLSTWKFEGIAAEVHKLLQQLDQPTALSSRDGGSSRGEFGTYVAGIEKLLKNILGPRGFAVTRVNRGELRDGAWMRDCRLFVIPGGADLPWVEDLHGKGCRMIRAFVEDGGSFLGVCAGSYFGSDA